MSLTDVAPLAQFPGGATVLVVGGTGFLGRHLVTRCRQLGADVTVLGRKTDAGDRTAGTQVRQCDLRAGDSVAGAIRGESFDYVFNLGGYIDHTPYFAGGRQVIEQHLVGLMNLIDALDREKLQGFVQVGSSDEYGDQPAPQAGSSDSAPISPYAFAKRCGTDLIRSLARHEGFPGVAVRLFLVYGPGQDTERLLPQVIRACLRDEVLQVSPGEQQRDFCFVEDVVEGLIVAGVSPAARGSSVNIASGEPVRIRDVVERVARLTGGGQPDFGARPYRRDESMALFADISSTIDLLGWRPTTPLDVGLATTIAAYRARWSSTREVQGTRSPVEPT